MEAQKGEQQLLTTEYKSSTTTTTISEDQNTMKLLLLLLPLSHASPPIIQINEPLPQVEDLVEALKTDGALIFTGLGEKYTAALGNLNKRAPYCLEGLGLTVEMDDGSERLTVARDTVGATGPFPDCVRNEAEGVGDAFGRAERRMQSARGACQLHVGAMTSS